MSTHIHTSCPWTTDYNAGTEGLKTVVMGSDGLVVAHCSPGATKADLEADGDVMVANAALCAAAPELLSALERLAQAVESAKGLTPANRSVYWWQGDHFGAIALRDSLAANEKATADTA